MSVPRPGSTVSEPAIVLDKNPFGESDAIIHLLTRSHGRVAAIAMGALRSRKRFGGALEPMNFVTASLRVPRERGDTEEQLWRLQGAEVQDSFLHIRNSLELLDAGLFAVRMARDLLPQGHPDEALFRALGRYLRDGLSACGPEGASWLRVALWSWWAHHTGFGDLSQDLEALLAKASPTLPSVWHASLAATVPDFARLAERLLAAKLQPLTESEEARLYGRWLELSSLPWPHWERRMRQGERGIFA